MDLGLRMHAERTPNPHSVKWVLGQAVAGEGSFASFEQEVAPEVSPLAARLLVVEGVSTVFLGPDFVTVTKRPEYDWQTIAAAVVPEIKDWAQSGEPALGPAHEPPAARDEGEVMSRIRDILDHEIRPMVAQDGGEVSLVAFEDGIVQVHLRGACAGCPSSAVTLKVGIEARLKQEVPEVVSVIAI